MWSSVELRESFLSFFRSKEHLVLPSYSLIPLNDPTLLIIGAGMAPLKPYFKGDEKPPSPRIATCQKCVRADDIEHVGRTIRHHTFFEMLGNFSFGDYFKEGAITWAWEYLTEVMKLDKERLWITIHTDDDEAHKIWNEKVGIPAEKIVRLSDNFWGPVGPTGPCGPDSELCYDLGEELGCGKPDCKPGCDCDRFLEIWNLVFTGLNKNEKGGFEPLPKKCIDTGLGFERLLMVMQNKPTPYHTDLFEPFMRRLEELSGRKHEKEDETAFRVIADHVRAVVFMLADGITPSNEGRGYVLRRILRRAVRFGKGLGLQADSFKNLVDPVIQVMGNIYTELKEKRDYIKKIISAEETGFERTLDQGTEILEGIISSVKKSGDKVIKGEDVFKLYDTYGFPMELTRELAEEKGNIVDVEGFNKCLDEQKNRSGRQPLKIEAVHNARYAKTLETGFTLNSTYSGTPFGDWVSNFEFTGYKKIKEKTKIIALIKEGSFLQESSVVDEIEIILEKTPFYAESGGQMGDTGALKARGLLIKVLNTKKGHSDIHIHHCKVEKGRVEPGMEITAEVDRERRFEIMRHHTATHILQTALRNILGSHVAQSGSLVAPDRLRFDFSHFQAMTQNEIDKVEALVNAKIQESIPVKTFELKQDEAIKKGAIAFFGDKYGEVVRMVEVKGFSKELCGGTHVKNTGAIGSFKIVGESAIGTGLRRIEAVTGMSAIRTFREYESALKTASSTLKTAFSGVPSAIEKLKEESRTLEKKLSEKEKDLTGI
ncbi:MAG: alanine--tRNA ligase, partial [Firmicutes bacterium]|nr:alanine--tRNA ligase [Bacillota bacterium]